MILVRQGLQERAQAKFARQSFVPHGNMKHLDIVVISFSGLRRTWSFHVVTLQKMAKKCTKNYNARAQPLFFSLNLLFGGVFLAVAMVVYLALC